MLARHAWIPLLLMAAPLAAQQTTETERNDDPSTATAAHLGDTLTGTIGYQDVDYFAMDLPAGAKIEFVMLQHGFCAAMAIVQPDGQHGGGTDCMSDRSPNDSIYFTATAGRYYVSLTHSEETPGDENHPPLPYKMRVALYTPPPTGAGNPMRQLASGFDGLVAMVAAPNGDLIVSERTLDQNGYELYRLWRVTPDGRTTTFATGIQSMGQLAIDAFGDLLVPSWDADRVVWRYNLMTGTRTIFTGPPGGDHPYTGITIGADGDVWLSQNDASVSTLFRFDALGVPKGRIVVSVPVTGLTTSQSGELFFMAGWPGDVYKLLNNATPQRVIVAPPDSGYGSWALGTSSVALDQDGWIYLIQPRQGKLLAFNAQYQLARDPLAQVLDSLHWSDRAIEPTAPAWMRDANGAMTSRMIVGRTHGFYDEHHGPSELLETNHAGMGAPGADPGLHVDLPPLRAAVLSTTYNDTLRMVRGGAATWSVVDGHLPAGLVLSANGVLTGIPTTKGTSEFAVRGVNGARAGFARLKIVVNEAAPVQVSEADIANALMGGASLSADVVTYLDTNGNNNGRLDVGDLRAYLRAQGQLSGSKKP